MIRPDATTASNPVAAEPLLAGRYAPGPVLWDDRPSRVAVISATDTWLGDNVAVAVLDPTADENATAAFTARARAWSRFYQPGIMELRDLVTWRGAPLAVWDAPAGGTLAALVSTGVVGAGRVEQMTAELASALDVIAAEGIIHGHIHPGAVGLGEDGHACLLPWPAASAPSGYGGEAAWQAPEVVAGEAPSPLSDRWSLGAVGLSALVGTGPGPLDQGQTKGLAGSLRRRTSAPLLSVLTTYMATEPEDRRLAPAVVPPAPSRPRLAVAGLAAEAARRAGRFRPTAVRIANAFSGRGAETALGLRTPGPAPVGSDLLRRRPNWGWSGVAGVALAGVFLSLMPHAVAQPSRAACPPCQPRQIVLAPPAKVGSALPPAPVQLSEAATATAPTATAPSAAAVGPAPSNPGAGAPSAPHDRIAPAPPRVAAPARRLPVAIAATGSTAPRQHAHADGQFRHQGGDGSGSSGSSGSFHSSDDQG